MPTQFSEIPFIQLLIKRNSKFLSNLEVVFNIVSNHLATRIPAVFPAYTLHDIEHSIRILKHIENLIENIDVLNEFEITLIIYSAFLHDIGMGPDKEIINNLKSGELTFSNIKYEALLNKFNGDEEEALRYLIRNYHSDISSILIKKYYSEYLTFPEMSNVDFIDELTSICIGHTRDFSWIRSELSSEDLKGDYSFNLQYILSLLRIGDILDIDGKRTPTILFKLIQPTGFSEQEWQKHYSITNVQKVRLDRQTDEKAVYLHGECSSVEIHRKLLSYIEYINKEIDHALSLSRDFQEKHRFYIRSRVENKITPKGYTLSSLKLEIDFQAITNLLMGEKIYGERKLGLREIIQNSIDACNVRKEIEAENKNLEDEQYQGKIKLVIDSQSNMVSIIDNGIGMTDYMIRNYFLSVGKSYYKSDDFLLQDLNYAPIGNFGIGFLACFMLSNNARIFTRNITSKKAYKIDIKKNSEYVSYTEVDENKFIGTRIEIDYDSFMECFESIDNLKTFIKRYFIFDLIDFEIINKAQKKIEKINTTLSEFRDEGILIDLSPYLNNIDGLARIKSIPNLINNISSLTNFLKIHREDAYIIANNKVIKATDDYPLSRLIANGKIVYLELGLYDFYDNDDLEKLYEVIDDIEEATERKEPTDFGFVFLDRNYHQYFNTKSTFWFYRPFQDYNIHPFMDFGFDPTNFITDSFPNYKCRFISVDEMKIYSSNDSDYTIPYDETPFELNFSWGESKIHFFLRNVLVEKFKSSRIIRPDLFNFSEIRINAFNENLIPNISRTEFDYSTSKDLSWAIGYAIHQGLIDTQILSAKQNELLKKFCNAFYAPNQFIKYL